jgi:hypothetical protein
LQTNRRVPVLRIIQPAINTGQVAGAPATVPPGSAESGNFSVENDNGESGIDLLEILGCPKTGIARADDSNIGCEILLQSGPWLE